MGCCVDGLRQAVWTMLLCICSTTLAAGDSPEIVEQGDAREVWNSFVGSMNDLDMSSDASFISGVFAVPVSKDGSSMAAAAASLVAFHDHGAGESRSGEVSGGSGPFLLKLRSILDLQVQEGAERDVCAQMEALWKSVHLAYNNDAYLAPGACEPRTKVSGCGLWAQVIQSSYNKARGNSPQVKTGEAVLALAKSRDLLVTVSQEKGTVGRCKEAIARKMPFLCFLGDSKEPRPYVCFGYMEKDKRVYLFAIDPMQCQPQDNGTPVAKIRTAWKRWPPYTYDLATQPTLEPVRGTVVLDISRGSFSCMFVTNWRRDERALEERVKRFLAMDNNMKERKE